MKSAEEEEEEEDKETGIATTELRVWELEATRVWNLYAASIFILDIWISTKCLLQVVVKLQV